MSDHHMGEEPLHSWKAHVFHIDSVTKKRWIPSAQHSVDVSIYYDNNRNIHRIISLDGNKVLINSTITPDLVFSKTSQKFGQWTDVTGNQTYGLGFQSEAELNEFAARFDEFKSNFENNFEINNSGDKENPDLSMVDQLKYENDRLKIALAQSSSNAKKWESELQQLRNTNSRLTSAIQESSSNIDKWNKQLSSLKEENAKLKIKVIEMEKTTGTCGSLELQLKDVIGRLTSAEKLLSMKDKELVDLKMKIDSLQQVDVANKRTRVQYQIAEEENMKLKEDITNLHDRLQHLNVHKDSQVQGLKTLQSRFNSKMAELMDISDKINELV